MTKQGLLRILLLVFLIAGCNSQAVLDNSGDDQVAALRRELAALHEKGCAENKTDSPLLADHDDPVAAYQILAAEYSRCSVVTGEQHFQRSALRVLQDGLERYPDSAELRLARGVHHWISGDVRSAQSDFTAVAAGTTEGEHLQTLDVLQRQAIRDAARAFLSEDWEQALITTASAGRCDETSLLLRLTEPKTANGTVWFEVAYAAQAICAQKLDDPDMLEGAFRILDEGLSMYPTSVPLPAAKGYALDRLGRRDEALPFFQTALSALPDVPQYERARFSDEQWRDFENELRRRTTQVKNPG